MNHFDRKHRRRKTSINDAEPENMNWEHFENDYSEMFMARLLKKQNFYKKAIQGEKRLIDDDRGLRDANVMYQELFIDYKGPLLNSKFIQPRILGQFDKKPDWTQ